VQLVGFIDGCAIDGGFEGLPSAGHFLRDEEFAGVTDIFCKILRLAIDVMALTKVEFKGNRFTDGAYTSCLIEGF
jgi:hypothetical protein